MAETFESQSVAFVFFSTGMGRWCKETCSFFFSATERTGGRLGHFRQDGENEDKTPLKVSTYTFQVLGQSYSISWRTTARKVASFIFKVFKFPKYSEELVQIFCLYHNRMMQSELLAMRSFREKKKLTRNKCWKQTTWNSFLSSYRVHVIKM